MVVIAFITWINTAAAAAAVSDVTAAMSLSLLVPFFRPVACP